MRCTFAAAALALALLVAPGATAARASTPRPANLQVEGGEERWHSQQRFGLSWSNPAPVGAVHYRLLSPAGATLIGDTRLPWPAMSLHLSVHSQPGAYTAEVWLEGADGATGKAAAATLRFDDTRPGGVTANAPSGWLGRPSFPYALRFAHPAAPLPPAGIEGYAVSIDGSASGHPCPADICSPGSLGTQGGIDDDSIVVPELPEGTSYVHAVAVSGSGIASAVAGKTAIRVDRTDPRTVLTGAPSSWQNQPVKLTASATDAASGMSSGGPGPQPYTAIRVDGGAPTVATGDSVSATVIDSGVHTVAYYARDAAGNVDDGGVANGHPNPLPATVTVRIDREPPSLAFVAAQDPADPERLVARLSDPGAGIDTARGSIGVRPVGSGERYTQLSSEVVAGALRARWNSSAVPPGEYEFRAVAYDAAGNSATSTVRVGGSAMRLRAPLKSAVKLTTRSGRPGVRYGRGVWFGGRLLAGRHTPLAGATVRVVETFAAGAAPATRVSTVSSNGAGNFGLRLLPGPSRQVSAQVAPTLTSRAAVSQPLSVSVGSRVALRVSSKVARIGGRAIVFRGRVASAGASIPADGKAVQLQFRLPGLPWSEFRTVRSDRFGRFRYAYRFSDDDSRGVRFQFRAYAPAQAGWPFEPAGSLPVVVRGV